MTNIIIEKYRTQFSRVFAILLIIFIIFSKSLWEYQSPFFSSILFSIGVLFAAIASLGRMWCSLYIAGRKITELVTVGPYSMTRNPLYVFSLIGALGVGLATETLLIPLIILIAFAWFYPSVIQHEESELRAMHGKPFDAYVKAVPKFFPKITNLKEPQEYIVKPIVFRKHIFSAVWFVWLIAILEFIDALQELGVIPTIFNIY